MVAPEKSELRRAVRARLVQLTSDDKVLRSASICDEVERHILANGASVVALFSPLADEPQLWPLVERLAGRMQVVLPRVEGEVMNFYPYGGEIMAIGAFGISEPQGGVPVQPFEIDAVVVPGVAFTAGGARMGRGKGFYDRYLSQSGFTALKIGVCYREQLVPEILTEKHDVEMDIVVYK
ncbi:MAG: 5-formyltetrahydrofolate cyclo-ligase [Bacteroidaceae bacterium]|nr:5-formyltetrahydrofolate cyclo-ligase [Bacteroidaceae bacterium]